MRKFAALPLAAVLVFLGVAAIRAQQGGTPPKPGPEHAKLAYFVGQWISEGDMKPSAYGPGGKFTFTQTCDWLEGKFALLCRTEAQMFGGTIRGLSVMSYDTGEGKYLYFETNSVGENNLSKGTVDGDTWTWTSENQMNGTTIHGRFTLTRLNDDSASYKYEMAAGAAPLALVMDGKQTRQK